MSRREGGLDWVHRPARLHATPEWYAGLRCHPAPPPRRAGRPAGGGAGRNRRGTTELRRPPRDDRRVRLAALRRGLRRPRGGLLQGRAAGHLALQQPVRCRLRAWSCSISGPATSVGLSWSTPGPPCSRHRHLSHQVGTSRPTTAACSGTPTTTATRPLAPIAPTRGRTGRVGGGPYGGGPCDEHNYTTGLLHYYYLTGDADARDAVLGLADWVINADDGRKNILGLLDPGPTGSASRTAEWGYHGPGRAPAIRSMPCSTAGSCRAIGPTWTRPRHSSAGRSIPEDDIAARGLLRTEARWSYTVYLSNLARYLAVKAEAGELDAMYAYARAGLIHYARLDAGARGSVLRPTRRARIPDGDLGGPGVPQSERLAAGRSPMPTSRSEAACWRGARNWPTAPGRIWSGSSPGMSPGQWPSSCVKGSSTRTTGPVP